MSKVRMRLITILSVVVMVALALGVMLGVPHGNSASAEGKDYAPTTIFSQGTGGDVGASEGESRYVRFSFRDEGNVYFRRDLALKWYEADKPAAEPPAEGAESNADAQREEYHSGKEAYFSMKFAFAPAVVQTTKVDDADKTVCPRCGTQFEGETCTNCGFSTTDVVMFDRYEILFESAEENISKKAKSINSIVFVSQDDGVRVGVKNAAWHQEHDEDEEDFIPTESIPLDEIGKDILITFGKAEASGEYTVTLKVGDTEHKLDNFTNIGGNYLEYRSSASTTPSTPITFTAKLKKPAGEDQNTVNQQVLMKELNGQSFLLGENGRVIDETPAVLVVNEAIYPFVIGQRYNLTTEAIDVCSDSPSVIRNYYMLHAEEPAEGETAPAEKKLHFPVSADYSTLLTSTSFLPASDADLSESADGTLYVSIRFLLRDGRFDNDSSYDFVYLTWYAAADAVKTFDNDGSDYGFIKVIREVQGPHYEGVTVDDSAKKNNGSPELDEAAGKYQTRLNEIAAETSAGKGAYFYLPSLRELISSDYADYRNLRFSIYYKKESSGTSSLSETSLRYNNLRFQIDMEGRYAFKVIASDSAGHPMKMYVDGALKDVDSSNVWDLDVIPTFTFTVDYKGADITEPGELDPASRGSIYNLSEFEIVDLGSNIKEYTLYYFDTASKSFPKDEDVPVYSEFVENVKKYAEDDAYKDCLEEIAEFDDELEEKTDEWKNSYNDYYWAPEDSLSFVPQKSGFYIVQLTYYDLYQTVGTPEPQYYYQAIDVRNPYDFIPSRTNWLSENVTSVVLFAISALLAVAIVVLFIVKPSDKKVEEVDLDKLKGKKKK